MPRARGYLQADGQTKATEQFTEPRLLDGGGYFEDLILGQRALDAQRQLVLLPEQDVAGEARGLRPTLAAAVEIDEGMRVALDPVARAAIDLDLLDAGTRRNPLTEDAGRDTALERG